MSEEVEAALCSEARSVVVEAPAGCGKTHEAAAAATRLAAGVPPNREVLLLAHTNAAVGEFRARVRRSGVPVRATTLDAFALELVAPFSTSLALPEPLIPGEGEGRVPFADLTEAALRLLQASPTVARAVGSHYPYIFLDEHQDARDSQHELAVTLARAGGSRLRFFGDPMQAIYDDGDNTPSWSDVCRGADRLETLSEPWRWSDDRSLGEWIMRAREALVNEQPVPTQGCRAVSVERIDGLPTNEWARLASSDLARALFRKVGRLRGTVAVLAPRNKQVLELRRMLRRLGLRIQEGADFAIAYETLDAVSGAIGDPAAMAHEMIRCLAETASGLNALRHRQIRDSIKTDGPVYGRRKIVRPLLSPLEPLWDSPDLATWCGVLRALLQRPPDWLHVHFPMNLAALASLRPVEGDDPRKLLDAATKRYGAGLVRPGRCVSTIHKAKGQEYDHVLVVHGGLFGSSAAGRRLLYTALSRARRSIALLVPKNDPSPLIQ